MKAIVDWVCLNVFIFNAVLINYCYVTFLHDITVATTKNFIFLLDRAGFEAHFVRFIQMTLFEHDGMAEKDDVHTLYQIFNLVSLDAVLLMFIVLPLFCAAMHFYTADIRKHYKSRVQIIIVPLALIPLFCFTNIDIAILSVIVFG